MKGILKLNEPLAPYTSWHVGGKAERYYRPADLEDLSQFLASLPKDEPVTWLGLGSNVLISDEGIQGTVIHMLGLQRPSYPQEGEGIQTVGAGLRAGPFPENSTLIRAEASITCAKLAKYCARNGLIGAEFFAGIPGTVGGALAMNAGAWGGETWQHVAKVEIMNKQGERYFRDPSEYLIQYRSVVRHSFEKGNSENEWYVAGTFQFEQGDADIATRRIKALLQERNLKQPIGVLSCGSVFKNPAGDHAGRLIEASNLKGFKIGGAEVSTKHANFIINVGNACAKDIFKLIQHLRNAVWQDHQVQLQTEVHFMGQFTE